MNPGNQGRAPRDHLTWHADRSFIGQNHASGMPRQDHRQMQAACNLPTAMLVMCAPPGGSETHALTGHVLKGAGGQGQQEDDSGNDLHGTSGGKGFGR